MCKTLTTVCTTEQLPELNNQQNSFQATQLLTHGLKHAQCSQTYAQVTEITHTVTQKTLGVKTLASNTNTENNLNNFKQVIFFSKKRVTFFHMIYLNF